MFDCWMHSPDDRPTFTELVARIDRLLEERTTEVILNCPFNFRSELKAGFEARRDVMYLWCRVVAGETFKILMFLHSLINS